MKRRLFLDCSFIYQMPTLNTGIQRVTRRIAQEALALSVTGKIPYSVVISAINNKRHFVQLESVPRITDRPLQKPSRSIIFEEGDAYFILDSSWTFDILKTLAPFRSLGMTVGLMVYDLLPIQEPNFFDAHALEPFERWIKESVYHADFVACISESSRIAFLEYTNERYPAKSLKDESVFSFKLGADIQTKGAPVIGALSDLEEIFKYESVYLAVGTLEPRKNHGALLDVFDILWDQGLDVRLVLVGKKGWKVESLVERINMHHEHRHHLFWFSDLSDTDVEYAYHHAKALIYPSLAEGFGLPIIEALYRGTPVLASDIPIFHEVAGDKIEYFDPRVPADIASLIIRIEKGGFPKSIQPGDFSWATWNSSALDLIRKIEQIEATKGTTWCFNNSHR